MKIVFILIMTLFCSLQYKILSRNGTLPKINKHYENISMLDLRIKEKMLENEIISKELFSLRHNPSYVESYARLDFGMIKKNEVLYEYKNFSINI